MSSYRSSDKQDRARAIAAVALVHVALGGVILTGLDVRIVRQAVERLQTFDIAVPEPPPPPPPPPQERPREEKADEGAPEKAPAPSPVVAPEPVLPVQSPVRASDVAGTGSASSAGAGGRGTGAGAGGTGTGSGSGSGFTPAQRVSRIPDNEYRRFVTVSGMRSGRVGVTVKVNTDGSPSNCRIVRSSGSGAADRLMCELTLRYVRFRPARDPMGRPVAQDMSWFPDWRPN